MAGLNLGQTGGSTAANTSATITGANYYAIKAIKVALGWNPLKEDGSPRGFKASDDVNAYLHVFFSGIVDGSIPLTLPDDEDGSKAERLRQDLADIVG